MKQATHFIEVVSSYEGEVWQLSPITIHNLKWSIEVTKRHAFKTIAIFKIYPKVKPMLAHYDNDLNAIIIE